MAKTDSNAPTRWLRLWTSVPDNKKLRSITAEEFRFYILYLCVYRRGEISEETSYEDISFDMRLDVETVKCYIETLMKQKLICKNKKPNDWDEWQYQSDSSSERVRKHRKNKALETESEDEAHPPKRECNKDETLQKRFSNAPRVQIQSTEAEAEREGENTHAQAIAVEDAKLIAPDLPPPWTLKECIEYGSRSGIKKATCEKYYMFQKKEAWWHVKTKRQMNLSMARSGLVYWDRNDKSNASANSKATTGRGTSFADQKASTYLAPDEGAEPIISGAPNPDHFLPQTNGKAKYEAAMYRFKNKLEEYADE